MGIILVALILLPFIFGAKIVIDFVMWIVGGFVSAITHVITNHPIVSFIIAVILLGGA